MRVCSTPGCAQLVKTGKCAEHSQRGTDHTRPNTADRGYGADHQRERAIWKPRVDALTVHCRRCGSLIVPDPRQAGDGWDLGHPDLECPAPKGPEHAARCNRAAAGRASRSVTG